MGFIPALEEFGSVALALGVPILIGILASVWLSAVARRIAFARGIGAKETVAGGMRLPVVLSAGLLGVFLGSLIVRRFDAMRDVAFDWATFDLWLGAVAILAAFYFAYKLIFLTTSAAVMRRAGDASNLLLFRKVFAACMSLLAIMTALYQIGVNVGPVLASLGIAGLAVALALQDTLSNYFAGLTIAADKPFRPGDYIKLDSGQEGFVEQIGWRTTRLKPYGEMAVVVPNNKITSAIITNLSPPEQTVRVYIECGVAYEMNLHKVETAVLEVANWVLHNIEGADPTFEPLVRYHTFAESNILFRVILRAMNYDKSFLVQHEFIKALHRRFSQLGIAINYPVRQVIEIPAQPPPAEPHEPPADVI